jgi:hypothetical protein
MAKSKHFTGQPIFNQLLFLIPRSLVRTLTGKHQSDRYTKKFRTFDHLITLLFSCFHHCTSLRELTTGLLATSSRLQHLGVSYTPRRSTLSDANQRRPPALFEELYHALFRKYYGALPDSLKAKRAEDRLFIIDSTTISLFSTALLGAGSFGLNGKKKGGIKAHLLLRARDGMPCFVRLTESKQNDGRFLPYLHLPAGSIVVLDRGYRSYGQLSQWSATQVRWITRLNSRAVYKKTEQRTLSPDLQQAGVKQDWIIELGNPKTIHLHPIQRARLVVYYDDQSKREYHFISNDFRSSALTIAALYKKRWQIELLFKSIKQNFNLQDFLGDSENAIRIQVWCTLIASLLLKIIRDKTIKNKRVWSMANLAGLIRLHLGTYIDLKGFLKNPEKALLGYHPPPTPQMQLFILK